MKPGTRVGSRFGKGEGMVIEIHYGFHTDYLIRWDATPDEPEWVDIHCITRFL